MKRLIWMGTFALLLLLWGGAEVDAQEVVINNGFEMANPYYYAYYGTVTSRGVDIKDVSAPGVFSWCYWQVPGDNFYGGLQQWIYVHAGETYNVSADICYHNC